MEWVQETINIFFIVFSIFTAINIWLIIGYVITLGFEDLAKEMNYYNILLVALTFPIFIMMVITKQLHSKGNDKP